MPKLWTETVATHRQEVREAILDATGSLVQSRGLLAVSMSEIAEATGIGRATLYKYFPDVETILSAWHQRHVEAHLAELRRIQQRTADPVARLQAVLRQYSDICRQRRRHGDDDLTAVLHRSAEVRKLQRQLLDLISGLVAEAAEAGAVRQDVPVAELASYCIHALAAAGNSSTTAVDRLLDVVWTGITPTPQNPGRRRP
ncbi:MAG TPA: TetR/AcrR family transcriptional regulator [Propionibacteriaceae bacterium]|nr:TetR/AcrR family transcriptional regulator [Propionibacteriaceae bacterium]